MNTNKSIIKHRSRHFLTSIIDFLTKIEVQTTTIFQGNIFVKCYEKNICKEGIFGDKIALTFH